MGGSVERAAHPDRVTRQLWHRPGFNPGTNAAGDADLVLLLEAAQAISGTLVSNLPRLQVAGSGTVGTPSVSGTLASNLPPLQAAADGLYGPARRAGLTANLPRLQVAASGTVTTNFLGSLASNLPSLSVASTGTETFSGSSSVVLQRVQVFATQAYLGPLGLTLQRVTLAAHGSVSSVIPPEPEPIIPPSRRPPPPLHPVSVSRAPFLRMHRRKPSPMPSLSSISSGSSGRVGSFPSDPTVTTCARPRAASTTKLVCSKLIRSARRAHRAGRPADRATNCTVPRRHERSTTAIVYVLSATTRLHAGTAHA